jgi:hypothetical protein
MVDAITDRLAKFAKRLMHVSEGKEIKVRQYDLRELAF